MEDQTVTQDKKNDEPFYQRKEQNVQEEIKPYQMLEHNHTFLKLLKSDISNKSSFEDIVGILNKKSEHRGREEIQKLKIYFENLKFFQNLKKENESEDIVYQCCKELKYRKYEPGQNICKYGEEGNEFYVIIKGQVAIFTPKHIEVNLSLSELMDYILANKEMILWSMDNKHLLEQAVLWHSKLTLAKRRTINKEGQLHAQLTDVQQKHEFIQLTQSIILNEGFGFGELALMSKKREKRSATVQSYGETHVAILEKEDFQKVVLASMERKLDQKVDFLKNFRISEGISRVNLTKLSYYLKEKTFRRRDIVYKEGDLVDGIYFIKDGEFEISHKFKTRLSNTMVQKVSSNLLKSKEMKVSIIGANQILGLDDMDKDIACYRKEKVQCITEKASVYFLSKEDYFTRFYKQMQKNVIIESQTIKEPFFEQRLKSLKSIATKENMTWLQKKERFLSKEQYDQEILNDFKEVFNKVQNQELCQLLMKYKLLKKPQIKRERVSSQQYSINDFDPNRHSTKDYLLKMAELYNNMMFNASGNKEHELSQSPTRDINKMSILSNPELTTMNMTQNLQFDRRGSSPTQFANESLYLSNKSLAFGNRLDVGSSAIQRLQSPQQSFQKLSIENQSHIQQPSIDLNYRTYIPTSVGLQSRNDYYKKASVLSQQRATTEADFISPKRGNYILEEPPEDIQSYQQKRQLMFQHKKNSSTGALEDHVNDFKDKEIKALYYNNKIQAKERPLIQKKFKSLSGLSPLKQQSGGPFNIGRCDIKPNSPIKTNKHSFLSKNPSISMETIQNHLMESQKSLLVMLQNRIQDKKLQTMYQSAKPNDEKPEESRFLPNATGMRYSNHQSHLSSPTKISINKKAIKQSNIYFNMFISKK